MWTQLTEWLPMWMAPNLVTTLGGSCCLMSYLLTAYYNYSLQDEIPTWLMIFNGVAILTYYTLDCMDGKQARRTGSSSPLGQLFDHGMDCVSNISHLSAIQCIVLVHPVTFFWLQVTLQFTFFQAQWEGTYHCSLLNILFRVHTYHIAIFFTVLTCCIFIRILHGNLAACDWKYWSDGSELQHGIVVSLDWVDYWKSVLQHRAHLSTRLWNSVSVSRYYYRR